ncbi:MAG: hypothetical protein KGS47_13900 [Chloroflexi bacterium]|nr:hypothetical protein [Chloroflexota bacterium]
MDPSRHPSGAGGMPGRAAAAVSRDMVLLVGALSLLATAIIIAVLVPPATRSEALEAPAAPTGAVLTPSAAPAALEVPPATPTAAAPVLAQVPTDVPAAYPAPRDPLVPDPTAPAPTMTPLLPTAAPDVPAEPVQPDAAPAAPTTEPMPAPVVPAEPTPAAPVDPAAPTEAPVGPTAELLPTVPPPPSAPPAPTLIPTATTPPPPPVLAIRGTTRWRADAGPVMVTMDVHVVPGATLIIEPGADVRIAPGIAMYVDGALIIAGSAAAPVRLGGSTPQRWDGIFAQPGSSVLIERAEVRGGGAGGTLVAVDDGTFVMRNALVTDNGGQIHLRGGPVEIRDSEISGNDLPYGAAIELVFDAGGFATLSGNRVGGNRQAPGASPVLLRHRSAYDVLSVAIEGNLLLESTGPNLALDAAGEVRGTIRCNTLRGGDHGFSLKSSAPQLPGAPQLIVRDNAIEAHLPAIVSDYLRSGVGRGATSDVFVDMRGNWWGDASGPYEPTRNVPGRGDAVGTVIEFAPWHSSRPACAPAR